MFSLKVFHKLVPFTVFLMMLPDKGQSQENKYPLETMRGRIVNARTKKPVAFAHVINKNTREGAITDTSGVFIIPAHRNDTLYIKSLSYFPYTLPISDSLVWQLRIPMIPLKEQVYELATLDLTGWGSYQQFKYRVLHDITPAQNSKLEKNRKNLQKSIAAIPKTQEQSSFSLGSPISALYMAFSKEGKSARRLEAAVEQKRLFLQTYQKYNREIVGEITGLKDALLDSFIMATRPSEEFLYVSSEYEITVQILRDLDRFKKGLSKK